MVLKDHQPANSDCLAVTFLLVLVMDKQKMEIGSFYNSL